LPVVPNRCPVHHFVSDSCATRQPWPRCRAGHQGTILPGRKATVTFAFDARADAKNLTVEVSPGFDYDASHWELTV